MSKKQYKTFNQIRDYTIENNGITLDILTSRIPEFKTGFYVSLKNGKTIDFKGYTAALLSDFIIDNLWTLAKKNHFLGIWIDNEKIYIDVSIWVRGYKAARKIAILNNQKAIYQISTKTCLEI